MLVSSDYIYILYKVHMKYELNHNSVSFKIFKYDLPKTKSGSI